MFSAAAPHLQAITSPALLPTEEGEPLIIIERRMQTIQPFFP
jgi:hypothetical protein